MVRKRPYPDHFWPDAVRDSVGRLRHQWVVPMANYLIQVISFNTFASMVIPGCLFKAQCVRWMYGTHGSNNGLGPLTRCRVRLIYPIHSALPRPILDADGISHCPLSHRLDQEYINCSLSGQFLPILIPRSLTFPADDLLSHITFPRLLLLLLVLTIMKFSAFILSTIGLAACVSAQNNGTNYNATRTADLLESLQKAPTRLARLNVLNDTDVSTSYLFRNNLGLTFWCSGYSISLLAPPPYRPRVAISPPLMSPTSLPFSPTG